MDILHFAKRRSLHVIFDEVEVGNYDIKYTIMNTLVLTFVVIGAARLFSRNKTA